MACTYGSPGCPEAVKKPCVYVCRLCVCVCTYTKIDPLCFLVLAVSLANLAFVCVCVYK